MNIKIKIEALTPIFIGDGESYFPTDCIVSPQSRELKIIDKSKFLTKIYNTPAHSKFLDLTTTNNKDNLLSFFRQTAFDCSDYSVSLSMPALDYITKRQDLYRAPIDTCIKESFHKKPILPGSTIKGMIKTAIAYHILKNNPSENSRMQANMKSNMRPDKFLTELLGNFDRDLLKLVSVSDFTMEKGKLKIIHPFNKGKKGLNPMPILLESIEAGSIFKGSIYINDEFIKSKYKNDILALKYFEPSSLKILEALKLFADNIKEEEKKRFKVDMNSIDLTKKEALCKLGKHAGAGSKSIPGYREIEIRAGGRLIRKDSYQSSLWLDGENNPMGWAILSVED